MIGILIAGGCSKPLVIDAVPAEAHGDTIAVLQGGGFRAPFAVPLWLDLSAADDDKAAVFNDLLTVELADGRIYLHQHNRRLGLGPICRVVDPRSRALSTPKSCLSTSLSALPHRIRRIGGNWMEVSSSTEGIGAVAYARFTPEAGQQTRFEVPVTPYVQADAHLEGDVLVVSAPCLMDGPCPPFGDTSWPNRTWRSPPD